MARRKKKPAEQIAAEVADQTPEQRQEELRRQKVERVYESSRAKAEQQTASRIGAQQGAVDGASMAQQLVGGDAVSEARQRYLGGDATPSGGAAPTTGGTTLPLHPAVEQRFYQSRDGRRLPESYLSLKPEQKKQFDEAYASANSRQEKDKSDAELALQSSATVLELLEQNNTTQAAIAADVAALAGRLEAVEDSDRSLELQVRNEGAEAAREAAIELSQSSIQASEISSRLDDSSRRAERSAEEFESVRQQAAAALAADREAVAAEVTSLKSSVKLTRNIAVETQESLLKMRSELNQQAIESQQLQELIASSRTVGDQKKTVDLAVSRAEQSFNQMFVNAPGIADLRAALALNVASLDSFLADLQVKRDNGLITPARYEADTEALLGLKNMILRNERRAELPGMDHKGDPIVAN